MAKEEPKSQLPEITDEPGMAERFQRGLRRALNTPPKPRGKGTLPAKSPPSRKRKKARAEP